MVDKKTKTGGKRKAAPRWIPWLLGLAILVAVALFAARRSEDKEFARLGLTQSPPGCSSASCSR